MTTDYKAIIFDLGNVVFNCSFEETISYWANISNQDKKQLESKLDFNKDTTHDLFEKAAITPNEFKDYISSKIGYNLSIIDFEKGWNAIYKNEINGVKELIIKLKKRFQIIALTNTNETHCKIWQYKYKDTLDLFDKVFISNELRIRKPESESFQICINYLNVRPNEIVFLDDKIEYIKGAEKLGIKGILVNTFDGMINDLDKIGIKTAF